MDPPLIHQKKYMCLQCDGTGGVLVDQQTYWSQCTNESYNESAHLVRTVHRDTTTGMTKDLDCILKSLVSAHPTLYAWNSQILFD